MQEIESLDEFIHRNPAFGAYCLHWLCDGYAADSSEEPSATMPFVVGMIGLMLLAPDGVRQELPQTANGSLANVFAEHPEWVVGIRDTLCSWVNPYWEAIRFGAACKTIAVHPTGLSSLQVPKSPTTQLAIDLRKRSRALGRLLRRGGDEVGIATLLGISAS